MKKRVLLGIFLTMGAALVPFRTAESAEPTAEEIKIGAAAGERPEPDSAKGPEFSAELSSDDFRIRDPFILVDSEQSVYYLYAQAGNRSGSDYKGVEVYLSRDLEKWSRPTPVLVIPKEWRVTKVWAPEVHRWRDAYYLFVTLTFRDKVASPPPVEKNWPPMERRGTWIFRSENPTGPFEPLAKESQTPSDWLALDGTLWVDDGTPWMIFCHEWVQLIDGTIDAVRLTDDLSARVGEPKTILAASSAPGAVTEKLRGKVTDGPFLYRSQKSGALFMIWSTFLVGGRDYSVLWVRSDSGRLDGPWTESKPLFVNHGGHGMIFTDLKGTLRLALHQPNCGAPERFRHFPLFDDGKTLKLAEEGTK